LGIPGLRKTIHLLSTIIFFALTSGYLAVEGYWLATGSTPERAVKPRFYTNVPGDLEPNLTVVDTTIKGLPFEVSTNAQGFRGNEDVSMAKKPGSVRILCLGDSYSYGVGVGNRQTFPAMLQSFLTEKYVGVDFQVINAATPFYGVFDELDYYRDKGRKLNADLVLVQFSIDDLEGMSHFFFRQKNKRMLGGTYHHLERASREEEISSLLYALSPDFLFAQSGAPSHEAFYGEDAHYLLTPSKDEQDLLSDRTALLNEKTVPALRRFWDNYLEGLSALRREVERDGSKLLVVVLPDVRQMGDYLNAPGFALASTLNARGFDVMDFTRLFRTLAMRGHARLFLDPLNEHLSPQGNAVAAQNIADRLRVAVSADGKPRLDISPRPDLFTYAYPILARLRLGEDGVTQLSGQDYALVETVSQNGLRVVREHLPGGDVVSLAADDPDAGGELILKITAESPFAYLSVICFRRIFHPLPGAIRLSWSLDGQAYTPLFLYVSDPNAESDAFDNIFMGELPFDADNPTEIFLKLELSGLARVFTQEADAPFRRFDLIFYKASKRKS